MPNQSDDRRSLREGRRNDYFGGKRGSKRYRGRRSIRLRDYDYSQPGAYFVTIVAQHRRRLFGRIIDGRCVLSPAGQLIERIWYELPIKFPTIRLDIMQIMPDHMHFVLFLLAPPGYQAAPDCLSAPVLQIPFEPAASLRVNAIGRFDEWLEPCFWPSLATVVGWFKSLITNEYNFGVDNFGWPPISRRLWQRDYFESIIRNERQLNRIRRYVASNPSSWSTKMRHTRR